MAKIFRFEISPIDVLKITKENLLVKYEQFFLAHPNDKKDERNIFIDHIAEYDNAISILEDRING